MNKTLPSWREGDTRDAVLEFVEAVTRDASPHYVPSEQRIAVFDNDGTLWCEQPVQVQVFWAKEAIAKLAAADSAVAGDPVFLALRDHDHAALHALGKQAVIAFALKLSSGMSVEAFLQGIRAWLDRARHPVFGRAYTDVVYQPQLELLAWLRSHGFKTFIVSGGGVDFMRAFAERTYGIPPEQVIGSAGGLAVQETDGRLDLLKTPELVTFDDRDQKVCNIGQHIGRRPILAFGNSDGDLAMMRYTLSGPGKRLALLLHHDDAGREAAYDRDFHLSPLNEALDRADEFGIRLVSMRRDWSEVFPPVQARAAA